MVSVKRDSEESRSGKAAPTTSAEKVQDHADSPEACRHIDLSLQNDMEL